MKNADYWRARFSILEESAHQEADQYIQSLEEMFMDAQRTVQADIERWYGRFATNNGISLTEARKMLTTGQLEEFRWTVDQYISIGQQANLSAEWLKKLENASAKFHVSRLEAIQTQIQQQIELLYGNQLDGLDSLLKKIAGDGYTQSAFAIQKGIGLGWDITALNQKKLETLLSKPWTTDGRTFSDRIWIKKKELVGSVQRELTQGLLRGDSPQKITDAIKNRFNVSRYQAGRLVHTETTYFNAVSTKQAYQDLRVEKVEILETPDSHTCEICQPLDGMVIPLAQYEPGVTVPPFHPNCRGTTCPHFADMDGERAARNADGDVYYVPANMTYTQWKKEFVDGGSKDGLTLAVAGGIIKSKSQKDGGSGVQTVGHINIDIYRCVTDDIATDEVVITPERVQHIKDRHPGDYERYFAYIKEIVEHPDYILEANKPYSALVLKHIEDNGKNYKLILRLKTSTDPEGYKNSIISFQKVEDKRYTRYTNSDKVLYKRE